LNRSSSMTWFDIFDLQVDRCRGPATFSDEPQAASLQGLHGDLAERPSAPWLPSSGLESLIPGGDGGTIQSLSDRAEPT
jgi:hypothetical protein